MLDFLFKFYLGVVPRTIVSVGILKLSKSTTKIISSNRVSRQSCIVHMSL